MKRIKYLAVLVFMAVLGVIAFQSYWLFNTYKINKEHFEKDVEDALNNAIRDDIVKDIHPRYSIKHKKKSTSCATPDDSTGKVDLLQLVKKNSTKLNISINVKDHKDTAVESTFDHVDSSETVTVLPSKKVEDSLKSLMDDAFIKVLAAVYGERIQLNSIDTFFKKQLQKKGIFNDYNLAVFKNDSIEKIKDSVHSVFSGNYARAPLGDTREIRAEVYQKALFLLKGMWISIFTSLVLSSIVLFSFLYMLKVILRQKKLSDMKNEFISNLTHEFKTPIATVTAAIEAMQNFGASDDIKRRNKYLDISLKQLHHLNSMVENALNISASEKHDEEIDIEVFNLTALVAESVDRFVTVYKGILVVNENYMEEVWIKADRSQMNNVISNLIDNAIKYSKGKAVLDISCVINKAQAELKIKDYGIGISQEHQSHIFDRFYRAPEVSGRDIRGFGLGLSYVKTVIEKHHGTLNLVSKENQGSEFIINLPLAHGIS